MTKFDKEYKFDEWAYNPYGCNTSVSKIINKLIDDAEYIE